MLKSILSTAAAAALIAVAPGAIAQTSNEPTPPPLPQADTQQATAAPAASPTGNFPALPLGHDGVREVQSELIALGFDPGPADGAPGPATVAAAQQYNENRGGSGPVPIDATLLARLQQDTGPRLTPGQVVARSQPRSPAPALSNPLVGAMQQFERNLRGLFNGSY